MTIHSSALVAILRDEPERAEFVALLDADTSRLMSAASLLEASMVLEGRWGEDTSLELDLFVRRASIDIVPFDEEQLVWARRAFRRFGKGRHLAGLNFGDCISYALAQCTGEPLLFKGNHFALTDVPRVTRRSTALP